MLGRGLRPARGKTNCLVLDHSGAVHRFGFADAERHWTLDGHDDLTSRSSARNKLVETIEDKTLDCPDCKCVFSGGRTCPSCGYYFEPRGKEIRTIEGELVEVGAHLGASRAEQLAFYLELKGFALERAFQEGWAAHKFREKHGAFPPWDWNPLPAAAPSLETRRWIKSRQIAFAKARDTQRIAG